MILDTAMNDTRAKVLICIFLIVATFCIYSQVQDHEFINFDDNRLVTKSSLVQAGLTNENIIRVFTTTHVGGWAPITSISYMLDYQLYGLNPKGFLLTNLFFHIANSLLLFLILFRMTGAIWQSAFVAVVFALHPLNVDSVAWVAERKNVLSTFFLLLTIWAYIHYAAKPTIKSYGLVFLLFAFGLMSKSMIVTLPFLLLLLDYWPLERFELGRREGEFKTAQKDKYFNGEKSISKLVLEKFPLLILSALCSIMTLILFKKAHGEPVAQDPVSILTILTNVMISYFEYLWKMLWPKGLAILYAHPGNTLAVWKGVLCGIALLVITTISIKLIRKAPYFVVGWFWYLGTLIPVIGFITLGHHLIADRYAYLSLIGIFVIIAWGVPELLKEWHYRKNVLKASAGILILTLMPITWIQVSHWKSSITVFKHAIKVTDKKYPGFSVAHNNLGNALVAEVKNEEAISHYKMAININPDFSLAHYNLGNILSTERKIEEAISHYKMAIKLKPDFAEAHNNLGNALFAERKNEEAISHYKMAIKLKPDYADAHNNLGNALSAEGKIEEAISHYKMAIKLKPDYALAHNNLGNALSTERKIEEAISHYKMAIKIKPDYAAAHNNLGAALFNAKMTEEAIDYFKEAIRIRPGFAAAQKNLETALLRSEELE